MERRAAAGGGADRADRDDSEQSTLTSAEDATEVDESWISWFLSIRGNELFCEVDEEFIRDDFNLTGLSADVPYFEFALDTILDVDSPNLDLLTEEQQETVDAAAEMLYGLIHARFILRSNGLAAMYDKFLDVDFGRCPRVLCEGQALLPVGQSDLPRKYTVSTYCPRCSDIFFPKSSRHANIDGAYFGTTFPHLFLMTYPTLRPMAAPLPVYVPRIFGFRIRRDPLPDDDGGEPSPPLQGQDRQIPRQRIASSAYGANMEYSPVPVSGGVPNLMPGASSIRRAPNNGSGVPAAIGGAPVLGSASGSSMLAPNLQRAVQGPLASGGGMKPHRDSLLSAGGMSSTMHVGESIPERRISDAAQRDDDDDDDEEDEEEDGGGQTGARRGGGGYRRTDAPQASAPEGRRLSAANTFSNRSDDASGLARDMSTRLVGLGQGAQPTRVDGGGDGLRKGSADYGNGGVWR